MRDDVLVRKFFSKYPDANNNQELSRYIREFVRMCSECRKFSQIKPPILSQPFTTSTRIPRVLINIRDNVGPYPADQTDNMFMVVMRVWFSKFVASSAVKDTE
jgi:hypothetical protein